MDEPQSAETCRGPLPVPTQRLPLQRLRVTADDLFEASADGLLVVARDGTVLAANAMLLALLGYTREQLIGRPVEVLVPSALRARHAEHRRAFAVSPHARTMGSGLELRAVAADGSLLAVDVSLGPLPAAGQGCVLVGVRDVSDRQAREDAWAHRALHDPLTGLANRSLVMDRIEHALARAHRTQQPVCLVFLDLDRFKAVNDTHGHAVGDEVLVATAERLLGATRAADTVARVGGDEFVVLVDEPQSSDGLAHYLERLRAALSAPVETSAGLVSVGCSAGSTVSAPGDSTDAAELLTRADDAMYADKLRHSTAR